MFEYRRLAHHVYLAIRRRTRLAPEVVDEARGPIGTREFKRKRYFVAVARLREAMQRVLGCHLSCHLSCHINCHINCHITSHVTSLPFPASDPPERGDPLPRTVPRRRR